MLQTQETKTLVPRIGRLIELRPVLSRDMLQLRPTLSELFAERESDNEILRVLERASRDNDFIAQMTDRGCKALAGYHLTFEETAALLSGDIRWIEARVGKLDARQRTWLECRLQQESW